MRTLSALQKSRQGGVCTLLYCTLLFTKTQHKFWGLASALKPQRASGKNRKKETRNSKKMKPHNSLSVFLFALSLLQIVVTLPPTLSVPVSLLETTRTTTRRLTDQLNCGSVPDVFLLSVAKPFAKLEAAAKPDASYHPVPTTEGYANSKVHGPASVHFFLKNIYIFFFYIFFFLFFSLISSPYRFPYRFLCRLLLRQATRMCVLS